MSEKVRILSFYENWVELKKMCSPEEWYELEDIILQLRFEGVDTDPKTISNLKIKMAWNLIRPSILKSNRNSRYQEKKSNTELQPNTDFEKEAEISPNKPDFYSDDTEVPQEVESASEGPIQDEFDELELKEEDMGTFIGTLNNFAVETRRIEHEEERSIDNMLKCLSVFDINKAKHQVFKSITIDENMKRVADCLDPLLGGFSKTDRSRLYISIIEDVLKSN